MEQFKKALKVRVGIMILACIIFLAFCIAAGFILNEPNRSHFSDFHLGFQTGLSGTGVILFIYLSIKYILVLRKADALKKLYYQENDERTRAISEKSGGTLMYVCTIIILMAGIVAGYFNAAVFFTLVGCSMFLLITRAIISLYYSKNL